MCLWRPRSGQSCYKLFFRHDKWVMVSLLEKSVIDWLYSLYLKALSDFKVFRYSFFGTIPNFLNRLLDSLLLDRSAWNLQYLLVLDWTLTWFTFCKNRYFHDNDKQKSSKIVKLKFCTIQISPRKAKTSILNCGVWQTKYTRTKKFYTFVLK